MEYINLDSDEDELKALLEIVESTPPTVKTALDDLHLTHKFILYNDIKRGKSYIPNAVIYDLYTSWCKTFKFKPFHKKRFFVGFKKYFNQRHDSGTKYYLLDPKPFNLSSEHYLRIKQEQNEKLKVARKIEKEEE
jgi:hypothetical protein